MASQNTSTIISQIYKSRRVILDLISKQGYYTADYGGFSISEINTMTVNKQLDMLFERNVQDSSGEVVTTKLYLKYYLEKALRPNNLQEIIDDLFTVEDVLTKNDTLFIVVKDNVNETLMNALIHIWETEQIFVLIVPLERLQFNILEHTLVPPHRVLTEAEKIAVMSKYNIKNDNEFPEITRFDPVAQAIGIRPGQVCEIIRPSKTSVSSMYYRICI